MRGIGPSSGSAPLAWPQHGEQAHHAARTATRARTRANRSKSMLATVASQRRWQGAVAPGRTAEACVGSRRTLPCASVNLVRFQGTVSPVRLPGPQPKLRICAGPLAHGVDYGPILRPRETPPSERTFYRATVEGQISPLTPAAGEGPGVRIDREVGGSGAVNLTNMQGPPWPI